MAERGDNCLIIVAGNPTTVTNSAIAGIIDEAGRGMNIADVYGAVAGVGGLLDGKIVDLGSQKRKIIEGLRRTPGSVLSGRHRILNADDAGAIVNVLKSHNIGYLFLLGGLPAVGILRFIIDAAKAASYPLLALGIPLSAENDVAAGDHNPGYGSAARFAASAVRDAARAASAAEQPLLVLELQGAQTGWLAAATTFAHDAQNPAPHAVLVPEKPVNTEALVEELQRAYHKYGYVVAVTSEGAKDTHGNALNGTALTALLSERLSLPGRLDSPGSLASVAQSFVARADAEDAYNLGGLAVRLAGDEATDYVLLVQRDPHSVERGERGYKLIEGTANIDAVSNEARPLPANYINDQGTNINEAFTDWLRPLVGGALPEYTSLA